MQDNDDLVAGVHTALHPDFKSTLALLLDQKIPLHKRIVRTGTYMLIRPIDHIFDQVSDLPNDVYVVAHPDFAVRILQRYLSGKLKIPPNAIIAIENEGGEMYAGAHLPPSWDPRDPQTVGRLAQLYEESGLRTYRVLDVDHLHEYNPHLTIAHACDAMGGQINILHVSGPNHAGHKYEDIVRFIEEVNPSHFVVLEGPESRLLWGLTLQEIVAQQRLVTMLSQYLTSLNGAHPG